MGIDIVLKSVENLLESILFPGFFMKNFPDKSIGTTSQILLNFEDFKEMILDVFAHFNIIRIEKARKSNKIGLYKDITEFQQKMSKNISLSYLN